MMCFALQIARNSSLTADLISGPRSERTTEGICRERITQVTSAREKYPICKLFMASRSGTCS